jgi:hypothetical protein
MHQLAIPPTATSTSFPPKPEWQFDAVSAYYDVGFSVIPLVGKRPALSSWLEYTERRANLLELRQWFKRTDCPFNIGIICGEASGGLVVVDLDTPDDARWWLTEHPASPLMVHTGRGGGMHVYYRSGGQQLGNRSKLFSRSIDLRSEHGYVVAPPSVHPETGKTYSWSAERPFDNYSWNAIPVFDPAWLPQALGPKELVRHDLDLGGLKAPRTSRTERRIEGLVRHLDREVADRSSRDFSVVMGLLRLHVPAGEVARLVEGHSKFRDNPKYLATTIHNALKAIHDTTRTG